MKKNKKLKFLSLIFLSLFVLFCQTIVYSAINATMSIRGDAYARAEADVRITDFRLASATNATSSFEEFGKTHIITELDLTDATSSITYYVEITNYGSVDVGIFDITGLPSGVNYSIKDYNLHDKICDDSGKCNNFIKKTYELTLTTTSTYAGNIQMNFDFRSFHQVTYTNIANNNYPTEVIDGGDLNVTFTESLKRVQFLSNSTELGYYKTISSGSSITYSNIKNDIEIKKKPQVAKLVSGELDKVGSEVCIGEECFYIISNNGEIVTMLSKYNLYVGGVYDTSSSTWTAYGTEATGIQNQNMIGWINKSTNSYYGTTAFSTTDSTYKGSIVEGYVNNYKNILETKYNAEIINARLITYEEVTNENTFGCVDDSTCNNTYPWIYTTSYWIETAYDSKNIWNVNSYGQFNYNVYNKTLESGVRPVIEISIDEIRPLVRVESGDLDTVGSELCISDECFYVISSDDNSTTMFAKYNLYVGNKYDKTNGATPLENPTGIQNSNAIGWFTGYTDENPIIGVKEFSDTEYWTSEITSYPAYVYGEGSYHYEYVENYKTYLEQFGIKVNEARLISKEELDNIGCALPNCNNAPSWLKNTSFWTGTAYSAQYQLYVQTNSLYYFTGVSGKTFGTRPVITIPKWLFSDEIEFTISGGTYYAKDGMSWGEWIDSIYNPTEALVQPDLCSNGREYYSSGSFIKNSFSDDVALNNNNVLSTDLIIAGAEYDIN